MDEHKDERTEQTPKDPEGWEQGFSPEMVKKLLEGLATPLSECIPESEVEW